MSSYNGLEVVAAAAIAALNSEIVIHPMDTIITRMQSKDYQSIYKYSNGSLRRTLFTGLYQGFGPTLLAGIPSSAAFFITYEASKTTFEKAQTAGYFRGVPKSIFHATSSAVAELVACAFLNPAEVLKQNAQISRQSSQQGSGPTVSIRIMKQFFQQPSALWSGYWVLVAGQLPSICLTFCLYESFKESWYEGRNLGNETISQQIKASILCAGFAGGCSSWFFVPIDVVKTRMRLAVGEEMQLSSHSVSNPGHKIPRLRSSMRSKSRLLSVQVIQDLFLKEGFPGFFRGSGLTCLAATLGSAMYIGCYEGIKLALEA
ncbi:hypothetical protein N7450_011111 [Penicillium hetheringtonii]|uniref:Mitochondrial thiamine pyrophosphate carrier 1 n=1 Tax=Penicillium hetheringtonii TaxID=911720 RepID=A0AAD6GN07_9EURO|nr:hypothetical protein N7450_011111 [Penicillium hetheringtonii]